MNRFSQIGPDVVIGKYTGLNESNYIARAKVGAFCAFGARTAINPFNHPTDWLSIHEFQYHPASYDWSEEYKAWYACRARLKCCPTWLSAMTYGPGTT